MAKLLRDTMKPQKYVDKLRREKDPDCAKAADFLEQYLFNLCLPEAGEYTPGFHERGIGEFRADADELYFSYERGESPVMDGKHHRYWDWDDSSEPEYYAACFCYETPNQTTRARCCAINIYILPVILGTSVYPLMIQSVMGEDGQTQDDIIEKIQRRYLVKIDRKTVGRHLKMLRNLGKPGTQYSSASYPLLVWETLTETPQTHETIAAKIRERYSVKMERKAVGRHLQLLEEMHFDVKRCREGAYK